MSYGGKREAEPLTLGGSDLAPTDAQPVVAELRGQSKPSVNPQRFAGSGLAVLPLFDQQDQVPAG